MKSIANFFIGFLGLAKFKPVRRYLGGHWERWELDYPVVNILWIKMPECGKRPGIGRRRVGDCEDYPN